MRTRVRELAEAQGLSLSQLQRRADIAMGTARRYWYNSRDGREHGEPLNVVDYRALVAIARVLGASVTELILEDDEPGPFVPVLLAA
jgi:transcriptional regulator with XRE-family HTH domain